MPHSRFTNILLSGTALATALLFAVPEPVEAQIVPDDICTYNASANKWTCTGKHQFGFLTIATGDVTIDVKDLTHNIEFGLPAGITILGDGQAGSIRLDFSGGLYGINTGADAVLPAHGIFIEAIGNSGTHGSNSNYNFIHGFGGHGNPGIDGKDVTLNLHGFIKTDDPGLRAIWIVNNGGDGGQGGHGEGTVGTGGNGANGGSGGDIFINNWADITSIGKDGGAIYITSQGGNGGGGGGGDGFADGIGGNGGNGGVGANISIINKHTSVFLDQFNNPTYTGGNIVTAGDNAPAIYATSYGGVGGAGGAGGGIAGEGGGGSGSGAGGTIYIENTSLIQTTGANSDGIYTQSIGGNAGSGGGAAGIGAVGGDGGTSEDGGRITILNSGLVNTDGNNSDAIFTQSIGGGGGEAAASGGIVAVGGSGTGGGDGGIIIVFHTGKAINTHGENSDGIVAQSIGGGGGLGIGSGGVVAVGGSGGSGGSGGTVVVGTTGYIFTNGANSDAIFAQSIGGGGGSGGGSGGLVSVGGDSSGSGNGGIVSIVAGGTEAKGDFSSAIYAQSIGGGGGTGISLSNNNDDSSSGGGSGGLISVGGKAGGGGHGDDVTITARDGVDTTGLYAYGIFAQSIGGGGGHGAGSGGAISVGGGGGQAGNGAKVSVHNEAGGVRTTGDHAVGIFAQSVGGGGGYGAGSGGAISVGGNAGTSGNSNSVSVKADAGVQTDGDLASAIFAQSVGGGGGVGHHGSNSGGGSGGIVSVGGKAGSAGNAEDVTVTADGSIETTGLRSYGIYAQSVGGGGGNGAGSGGAVSVGGGGGTGGTGAKVTVTNTASVTTGDDESIAIFAQSVGGGGGMGRGSGGIISVGGSAGTSGNAGQVDVTNSGKIITNGAHASGLIAQSIGGGGGIGHHGDNSGGGSGGLVSVGGNGGGGGDGAIVNVTNHGDMNISGSSSYGIFAQSIGGGGGNGVSSGGAISVGGSADDGGGDGKNVTVINTGDITTNGFQGAAIFAQTVGGGGGNGGSSGGALTIGGSGAIGGHGGVEVKVTNNGNLSTTGENAQGIYAHSIGGGGGNGGNSVAVSAFVSLSIGGKGAAAGDGGKVIVKSDETAGNPSIITDGDHSTGIDAQSIGGGGGSGGYSTSVSVGYKGSASFAFGGSAGGGGHGDVVDVNYYGDVTTNGHSSHGIFAQSIGGGGGNGGAAVAITASNGISASLAVGGSGGAGGDGKAVTLYSRGNVITTGDFSNGLYASSKGMGGGHGGLSVAGAAGVFTGSVSIGGKGGGGGIGDEVILFNSGIVNTDGYTSRGLYAQSLGGGGGTGGLSISAGITFGSEGGSGAFAFSLGGSGGTGNTSNLVEVVNAGSVTTTGESSEGIFAQSVAGGGGDGGISLAGALSAGSKSGTLAVTIGGSGGDANAAGEVTVFNVGDVTTSGNLSDGIFAQSVGNGGGKGGLSGALTLTKGDGSAFSGAITLGGSGGTGGTANDVKVTNDGVAISTSGDSSAGVYAQSQGGGGGYGGSAYTFSMTAASGAAEEDGGIGAVNVNLTIGGAGGDGGTSGKVTVTNDADTTINTTGNDSIGVFAHSIAGGGGNGGLSVSGNIAGAIKGSTTKQISVVIGGSGGTAHEAGDVVVLNDGNITTTGAQSAGIVATSIGGKGGNGGSAFNGSLSKDSLNAQVVVGGNGGSGGTGGDVHVTHNGNISTAAKNSIASNTSGSATQDLSDGIWAQTGIYAQSIGGGGGNGGSAMVVSLDFASPETKNISVNVAVGGTGGDGGVGGNVTVDGEGSVTTLADNSAGVFAQSVGGGGGNGGSSLVSVISLEKADAEKKSDYTIHMALSVGGKGGDGNIGGDVNVIRTGGLIRTSGDGATGIFAQSTGGGGGNAGQARTYSAMLGNECSQSLLKIVPVVGGKCGNGDTSKNFSLQIGIGGDGGTGNNAGKVTVDNTSALSTKGTYSHGIFAQSVGGGGGTAGNATAGLPEVYGAVLGVIGDFVGRIPIYQDLSIEIGGSGGASGNGGVVIVNNHTNINIGSSNNAGMQSFAILAQSVGGGGGVGGTAGIGLTGKIGVGGKGGASGDGGAVSVANSGDINTYGVENMGVFAQSVGGGGGLSLARIVADDGVVDDNRYGNGGGTEGFMQDIIGVHIGFGLGIGLGGGAGGDGGDIQVHNPGNITTSGDGAVGIFAQSVGGGGGLAQFSNFAVIPFMATSNGDAGIGGDVTVTSVGNITTSGQNAEAIFAQTTSYDGSGSQEIKVTVSGNAIASGLHSSGILVDNNNTDYGRYVTHDDGAVVLVKEADYSTYNTDHAADVNFVELIAPVTDIDKATQLAHSSGGTVDITINTGAVVIGGSGAHGAGISIHGTSAAHITNKGTITNVNGVWGTAIYGTAWNDRVVVNSGTITGNVVLIGCDAMSFSYGLSCKKQREKIVAAGQGNSAYMLVNLAGGTLNTGNFMQFEGGGGISDHGTISPGGLGQVIETGIRGNLWQDTTSVLDIDVDFTRIGLRYESDLLTVKGDAFTKGTVNWQPLDTSKAAPGDYSVTFFKSTGGLTGFDGLSVTSPDSILLSNVSLYQPDSQSIGLNYTIDFTPPGLPDPHDDIGDHVGDQIPEDPPPVVVPPVTPPPDTEVDPGTVVTTPTTIITAHGTTVPTPTVVGTPNQTPPPTKPRNVAVDAAFGAKTIPELSGVYGQLSPAEHTTSTTIAARHSQKLNDNLNACEQVGGDYRFIAEGQCKWMRFSVQGQSKASTANISKGHQQRFDIAGGLQKEIADDTYMGFGLAYSSGQITQGAGMITQTDLVHGSFILKRQWDATVFSMTLSGGYSWHKNARTVSLQGVDHITLSDPESAFLSTQARVAHSFDLGDGWYVSPAGAIIATKVWREEFVEEGAAHGVNMVIHSEQKIHTSARPEIEIGREFVSSDGSQSIRPFVKIAKRYALDGGPSITAHFVGTPDGVDPLTVDGSNLSDSTDYSAGIRWFTKKGYMLRLEGNMERYNKVNLYELSLKLALPF